MLTTAKCKNPEKRPPVKPVLFRVVSVLFHLLFISFTAKQLILIKVSFNVFEQRINIILNNSMNEQVSLWLQVRPD